MIPGTGKTIASLLDITPETFSRELNRLIGEGLIEVTRNQIKIRDLQSMQQASSELV